MRIKNYLFHSFSQIFFPTFLVLFFIASVVIFIRIAGVTFVVQISFLELLSLYFYTLPLMLFFVIPLSFFVACALSLSRLSFDYELPVLFALILTPLSDLAYRQFLEERKNSININLQAGEFGQKLGNWLVYVKENHEDMSYKDIVLLSFGKEGGLIFAKDAKIINKDGVMEAILDNGKIYRSDENAIEKIAFKTLILRNSITDISGEILGVFEYWNRAFYENDRQRKTLRDLSMYVLMSLFPFVSLYFFPLLGVKNPRYQRNHTILQSMLIIGVFYALTYLVANYLPLIGMVLLPIVWGLVGYFGYQRFVRRYY